MPRKKRTVPPVMQETSQNDTTNQDSSNTGEKSQQDSEGSIQQGRETPVREKNTENPTLAFRDKVKALKALQTTPFWKSAGLLLLDRSKDVVGPHVKIIVRASSNPVLTVDLYKLVVLNMPLAQKIDKQLQGLLGVDTWNAPQIAEKKPE